MSRAEPGGIDDRLRQLLDVEQRLQDLVRAAEEQAAARVALARADARRARSAAEGQQAGDAGAHAEADRAAHDQALVAFAANAQAGIQSLSSIPDDRIDALARLALDRAIAPDGDTP